MSADEPLYRAVYPEGTHLASSRNTDGAFRGIYHCAGLLTISSRSL